MEEWIDFNTGKWQKSIDVEDFIINNYKEYTGDSDFLKGASRKTNKICNKCAKAIEKEYSTKILDAENYIFSGIDNFDVGYIDKKNEVIFGLQTDSLLKQFVNPSISLNKPLKKLKAHGYRFDKDIINRFKDTWISLDDMLYDTYTSNIKKYKDAYLFGCLPENFSRGFILGDYRRLPLYGIDYLILCKKRDLELLKKDINYSIIRTREEVVKQIKSLYKIKNMANHYGFDISKPAKNAKEAVQWLYFGFLATLKETTPCSLPIGNNSAFIDIYIERDIKKGILTEDLAQELIDQLMIKLRIARFLRTDDYTDYYYGDNPIISETIGGINNDKSLITKTAYRMINSIENIGEYSCPNICILWSKYLPNHFKKYCSRIAIKHNVLQFINGDLFTTNGYAITGVSGFSKIGKQIDYNGGSINLPKLLLYAINEGKDEITGETIINGIAPIEGDILDYKSVVQNFTRVLQNVLKTYCDAINILHCLHDKYCYESAIMSFNDTVVERFMTIDLTGLSVLVDSLSAIRYSDVKVVRNNLNVSEEFISDNLFPRFGNNDDKVDLLASDIIKLVSKIINQFHFYRNAKPKIGINSFSCNILYGKNTGATPDGRFKGIPYSVGVNPTTNADSKGLLESLNSILKIPSNYCTNGIITTININRGLLGNKNSESADKLLKIINNFFEEKGRQIEINIIDKNKLIESTNKVFTDIVLRNSGCVLNYDYLKPEQKESLIDITFHKSL